jgi:hypothetical protein
MAFEKVVGRISHAVDGDLIITQATLMNAVEGGRVEARAKLIDILRRHVLPCSDQSQKEV